MRVLKLGFLKKLIRMIVLLVNLMQLKLLRALREKGRRNHS